jgi:hypothetical protein
MLSLTLETVLFGMDRTETMWAQLEGQKDPMVQTVLKEMMALLLSLKALWHRLQTLIIFLIENLAIFIL